MKRRRLLTYLFQKIGVTKQIILYLDIYYNIIHFKNVRNFEKYFLSEYILNLFRIPCQKKVKKKQLSGNRISYRVNAHYKLTNS